MTAKRFTYEYDEYSGNLFDNKMNTFYHIEDSDENIEVLCDRLNWLVNENEQLKKENEDLQDEVYILQDDILNKRVRNLIKENEELKQSNERLLKMLDNVANYMQKQNKYMPVDDFAEWWNGIATKGLDDGDVE